MCRPFRQPANEPRVPIAAVGDEHDGSAAFAGETFLLRTLYAVEHLHFKIFFRKALRGCTIGQPPYQRHIMRAESCAHAAIFFLSPQHLLPKLKIVSVDILLAGKRDFWRFVVCALDQSDRWSQMQKFCEVLLRSMKISLQAYTHIGMRRQRAAIEFQS